uniref:Zeta toxin domain-containing protein n=1 Tax=Brassica campestris TaxID=3711 RepID=A0A3P5ZI49_BRACM|nr:unnamed protein product [Brassica rapa]
MVPVLDPCNFSKNIPRLRFSHKHKSHEKLERFSHNVGKIRKERISSSDCQGFCRKLLSTILSADPKKRLKHIRLERVTKYLKVARVWIAYVDDSEVMAPVAHKDRSPPVLLFMGGGMAAGKSTVLKDILKEPFCAGADAVIIEADDRKEPDVIYRESSKHQRPC